MDIANNTSTLSVTAPPMSVFEVMGDEALVELRAHASGLLRACATSTKIRRDAPFVGEHLDAIEAVVRTHVSPILSGLAEVVGMPAPGQSLTRGAGAPPHGDYRIMSSGCWVWMRTLDTRGYPVLGRRTKHRHNRPAILYWMLANGPLPDDRRLERTCGERLCINPDHGEVITRQEHGARVMRSRSVLDWDAVNEIRQAIPAGVPFADLAARFGVGEHTIGDVFRNKTWRDPDYEPGVDRSCDGCRRPFKTTNLMRRYCSTDCLRRALGRRHGDRDPSPRELRDRQRLRRELDSAFAEFEPQLDREVRTTWGPSLDATLGATRGTLHDVLADTSNDDDPLAQLEAEYAREVLGDLTEDRIASLTDDELLELRARLIEAGLVPSTCAAVA